MPEGASDIAWIPKKIGTLSNARQEWTGKDDAFISKNWGSMSVKDVAVALRRSAPSVKARAIKLGVTDKTPLWSDQEIYILTTFYAQEGSKITREKLAEIGYLRTQRAIRFQATRMGLERSNRQPIEIPIEGKRAQMMITTTEDIKQKAQKLATRQGVSVAKFLESLILQAFQDNAKQTIA